MTLLIRFFIALGPTFLVNTIASGGHLSRPKGPYSVSPIGTGFDQPGSTHWTVRLDSSGQPFCISSNKAW